MLFHHPDITHHHAAIHRLAHVIHGQQADLYCGRKASFLERFRGSAYLHGARKII